MLFVTIYLSRHRYKRIKTTRTLNEAGPKKTQRRLYIYKYICWNINNAGAGHTSHHLKYVTTLLADNFFLSDGVKVKIVCGCSAACAMRKKPSMCCCASLMLRVYKCTRIYFIKPKILAAAAHTKIACELSLSSLSLSACVLAKVFFFVSSFSKS